MVPRFRKPSRGLTLSGRRPIRRRSNQHFPKLLPRTGTGPLQNSSAPQRDRLLGYIAAAEASTKTAVTRATLENQARAWRRWTDWCNEVGLGDEPFLDSFPPNQRIRLLGGFATALRQGRFSPKPHGTLVESTVRNTIAHVAQTFRENNRPDPTKDEDGQPGRFLSRFYRSFKNEDPKRKQQKALPAVVLRELAKMRFTETQMAIRELAIGAYFFACRSCEYLHVPNSTDKKTKRLTTGNIVFQHSGAVIPHSSPLLITADSLSITFKMQTNGRKMQTNC